MGTAAAASVAPSLAANAGSGTVGGAGLFGGASSKAVALLCVKWIGIGALVAVGAFASLRFRPAGSASATPSATFGVTTKPALPAPTPEPTAPLVEPISLAEAPPVPRAPIAKVTTAAPIATAARVPLVAPRPSATAVPSSSFSSPSSSSSSSLAEELELVRKARVALAERDGAAALVALDRYFKENTRGSLVDEATVLRIDALQSVGKRAQAREMARTFLADRFASPYAGRVERLLHRIDSYGEVDTSKSR